MVQQRCDVKYFSYKEVWLLQAPTSKFCFCPRVLLHVHEQDTDPMSPCMHGMNIKMVAKIQLELRWGARMEGGGEWMGGGWGGGEPGEEASFQGFPIQLRPYTKGGNPPPPPPPPRNFDILTLTSCSMHTNLMAE